ncbi:hypothetical protein BuS5_01236 [Desulfosarcina sp. BuS5]|nr:hypothetical protein BuS5_01236 [Desulfosarcina sp. BuS5]
MLDLLFEVPVGIAGFPATTIPGEMSFVTTEPAPTILLSQIVTLGSTTEFTPMNTLLPMRTVPSPLSYGLIRLAVASWERITQP